MKFFAEHGEYLLNQLIEAKFGLEIGYLFQISMKNFQNFVKKMMQAVEREKILLCKIDVENRFRR